MSKIKLTDKVEADMFQVNVLCQRLKQLQKVQPMAIHDLSELATKNPEEAVRGLLMNTIHRLQADVDGMAKSMGVGETEQLLGANGALSLFFRTVLLLSVNGTFPDYTISPPLTRKNYG